MSRKIVVALGGNAILSSDPSAKAQQEALVETAKYLVKLIKNGDDLIITHGNGPQVGNLLLQHLAADSEKNPAFPLDSLVAMTEGSIGFWLQNALQNALLEEGIEKDVASVVTQVVVDKNDPAFVNLSKPIGPFYSEEEAKAEAEKSGATFKEEAILVDRFQTKQRMPSELLSDGICFVGIRTKGQAFRLGIDKSNNFLVRKIIITFAILCYSMK